MSGGLVCGAALVAAGSLLLGGCASARLVLVEPGGGAVVIPRNTPKSREKAYALMARQCPRGFHIVREEEVLVGSTVTREYETEFDRIREEVRTTEEERVRRNVEWRITFSCR